MTIKYALRNLIRSPWRTILYISVAFLVTLSVTASLFVYGAAAKAKTATEENYMFIASLIPKSGVKLSDMQYCLNGTDVIAYNVAMTEQEGVVLGGEYMLHLPEQKPVDAANASLFWQDDILCEVTAVENLGLVYPFFTGECTIREGTGFTKDGYLGLRSEVIIPWWLAEEYGVKLGDMLTRRYRAEGKMSEYFYWTAEVVGIYETSVRSPDRENYPVYIPMSIAEFDYFELVGNIRGYLNFEIHIDRADFILPSRDSFESFVLQAKENGLNFTNADLVFNNRPYDVLLSELNDIHMIALIVAVTVLVVGLGMLVFFTVYLCNSRKNERVLLASLGMKKGSIFAMIATEIAVMLVLAVGGGLFAGRYAADMVCAYVETTISEKAEISESIQMSGKAEILENIDPMERENSLKISVSEVSFEGPSTEIYEIVKLEEGEVGIAKHTYYHIGNYNDSVRNDDSETIIYDPTSPVNDVERTPFTAIGLTDMDALGIKLSHEEIPDKWGDPLLVYVSEDFDYSDYKPFAGVYRLFITPWDHEEMAKIDFNENIGGFRYEISLGAVIIGGTYEPNEYFSGNDILLSMEDYRELYQEFSVTDEEFDFGRMEIFEK